MDTTKIKIRVGEHEFEAEGPVETVQAQLAAFKELIGSVPNKNVVKPLAESAHSEQNQESEGSSTHVPIEKILHASGRVVSLTALPASAEDAALLIMLGHKDMRNNVAVTGQEIGDGLAQSGKPVLRVDRIMDKPIENAYVLKSGIKRSTRYRLTNAGLQRALSIAKDLIASLP